MVVSGRCDSGCPIAGGGGLCPVIGVSVLLVVVPCLVVVVVMVAYW